jgi:inner membrane protein
VDSLTQLVLGAAVAGTLTRRRRGLVYGAILGTLPDFDVLLRFSDPLDSLTLHRTASHSLIALTLLAPLLCWLCARFDRGFARNVQSGAPTPYWRWLAAFWLALITHPLLDYTTIYGTQLFWPLIKTPFGTGHMFIIDPCYTLPLIFGTLWHWRGRWLGSALGLAISSGYLALGLYTQQLTTARVLSSLAPLRADQLLLVEAAPLSIFMHRVVLREPNGYWEAYVSLLADHGTPRWERFYSDDALIAALTAQPKSAANWQRLVAFSHGFVTLESVCFSGCTSDAKAGISHIVVSDLRMGSAPRFMFSYDFGPASAPFERVTQRPSVRPNAQSAVWVFKRLYTPAADMPLPSQLRTQ